MAAANSDQIETLQASTPCATEREALRACYDVPTKALNELKQAIRAIQPTATILLLRQGWEAAGFGHDGGEP